jgi:hypothetical protein
MSDYANKKDRRSRRSFMRWPPDWLWIAVVVAVVALIAVGVLMGPGYVGVGALRSSS